MYVYVQAVPLVIGQFLEMVDQNNGIVGSTTGSNYYVRILSTLNRELLKPSSSIAMHRCPPGPNGQTSVSVCFCPALDKVLHLVHGAQHIRNASGDSRQCPHVQ